MNILIRSGTVYDGGGGPPRQADVLIEDGLVRAVEPGIPVSAAPARVIDAEGRAVTPGFVDIHRHADIACLAGADFGETELAQGITSAVVGNCGMAPVPAPENP
jgi:N-acyl-D-amino-acid deacylase